MQDHANIQADLRASAFHETNAPTLQQPQAERAKRAVESATRPGTTLLGPRSGDNGRGGRRGGQEPQSGGGGRVDDPAGLGPRHPPDGVGGGGEEGARAGGDGEGGAGGVGGAGGAAVLVIRGLCLGTSDGVFQTSRLEW